MIHLPGSRTLLTPLTCAYRYWQQHVWQGVLMLLGIALGVAVVFSVDIANQSAKRAFAMSLDAVTGRTTHQMVGGGGGVDEAVYTRLRTELGFKQCAPVIDGSMIVERSGEQAGTETLQLLGVDIFAEPMFRDQLIADQSASTGVSASKSRLALLQMGTVILGNTTAKRLNLNVGDSLQARVGGVSHTLKLANVVDTQTQPVFETLAMVDIATAQVLLSMQGRLSRIDLVVDTDDTLSLIRNTFTGISVVEATKRNNALQQMTAAFHTNLLAMSLLALLVGAFLIYNTVTLSVLQRRALFGQFRLLGVTRSVLAISVIVESLLFAIVGIVLGLVLGYLLGGLLLHLVTRTINDLFFVLDVRRLEVPALSLFKAVLLGIGATLVAVAAPAAEAANSPPVTLLQRSRIEAVTTRLLPLISVAGFCCGLLGLFILVVSSSLWMAFAALFLVVIGYSLLIPLCLVALVRWAERLSLFNSGLMGRYPVRSLTASLSRTAVAVAALVVAVSATAGVGIMIGSFRLSVADWLDNTLQADLYIRDSQSLDNPLPEELLTDLMNDSDIAGLRLVRMVDTDVQALPARMMALQFHGEVSRGLSFVGDNNDAQQSWQRWSGADAVFISEPLAFRHNLAVNESISISTDSGNKQFTVAGVFTDYGAGKGVVIMEMDTFHLNWSDRAISSIGVSLAENANSNTNGTIERLRARVSEIPSLILRSNRDIRELSMEIFDRTFSITHVLRLLTVGVAFVGILSAMIALSLERKSEFSTLRALGLTPAELRKMLFLQTGLMGLIAGVLALPLGIIMSAILVSVINLRSFGWTMQFSIPGVVLIESILLAVFAALLAGWYPAKRLSHLSTSTGLRHQ